VVLIHPEEGDTDKYVAHLLKEIELYRQIIKDKPIVGYDLGGGTPSYLSIENLEKIIASKANLIKKALDCADPTVVLTEDRVAFPWYKRPLGSGESMAAMHFITAICRMAKNAKRITAKEKEVPNDKYAFRCFLLRLGFIGSEFKETRKRLLQRLEGSSAFRTTEESEA
jgi:hypothetical protein